MSCTFLTEVGATTGVYDHMKVCFHINTTVCPNCCPNCADFSCSRCGTNIWVNSACRCGRYGVAAISTSTAGGDFVADPPAPREAVWRAIDNEEIFPYGPIQESDDPGFTITGLDYENGVIYIE